MRKVRDGIRLVEQDGGGWFAQREPPPVPAPQETWNRDHHCRQARRRPSARAMGEGHGPAGLTEEEWLEQPRQAWEQTANRALKDMRRSDVRRHVTLPQSWIQRENWEFETHRCRSRSPRPVGGEFVGIRHRSIFGSREPGVPREVVAMA